MKNLLNPLQSCDDFSIGGIQKVWVAQRQWFGKYWGYVETSDYQYGRISGPIAPLRNIWFRLFQRVNDAQFTQTQSITPSRSYNQTLTISFNQMDIVKRDTFEQMVSCQDPIFIFLDRNDNYWLLGESYGCKVDWNGKTDQKGGINDYTLTISTQERYPIRQVNDTYINTVVYIQVSTFCDYTWVQICALDWNGYCALVW